MGTVGGMRRLAALAAIAALVFAGSGCGDEQETPAALALSYMDSVIATSAKLCGSGDIDEPGLAASVKEAITEAIGETLAEIKQEGAADTRVPMKDYTYREQLRMDAELLRQQPNCYPDEAARLENAANSLP